MDLEVLKSKLSNKVQNNESHYSVDDFHYQSELFYDKHNAHYEYEDLVICAEEMAELIQCISKVIRGKNNMNDLSVLEEIADVEFCLDTIKHIYFDNSDIQNIEYIKDIKYERFMEKLDEYNS